MNLRTSLRRSAAGTRSHPGSIATAAAAALVASVALAACGSDTSAGSATPEASPVVAAGNATEGGPAEGDAAEGTVTIEDHWERSVDVPVDPERVVVMEWEGLVTKSMRIFGVESALVGVDTATKKMGYREELVPSITDAVDLGSPWSGVNYEQLAGLDPDVVFLEAWVASEENRTMHQDVIDRIESLDIPVVVLISPSNFDEPDIRTAWEHITITGEVFGKQDEAEALVERLDEGLSDVTERTADIPEEERADVAYFATINYLMGEKSIQDYFLTEVVGADNVAGAGTFVPVSEEQLLALDPDAMIVAGHEGYLDLSHIYEGRNAGLNWGALQELRAIDEEQLVALGYDEWRATVETPIALLKMAKLIYPDRFADVDVEQEEIDFYQDVYGMDEAAAREAIEAQKYVGDLEVQ